MTTSNNNTPILGSLPFNPLELKWRLKIRPWLDLVSCMAFAFTQKTWEPGVMDNRNHLDRTLLLCHRLYCFYILHASLTGQFVVGYIFVPIYMTYFSPVTFKTMPCCSIQYCVIASLSQFAVFCLLL